MAEPTIVIPEMDTTLNPPTPPNSKPTTDLKENQDQENITEKNLITTPPNPPKEPTTTGLKPSSPSKKRGRPKTTDKDPTPKKPKQETPTKEKKQKQPADSTTPKQKRGRQPGSTSSESSFTQEQDAYIRELYTSPEKYSNKDIHAKFEERFRTEKSSNVVRFRWYKLKEGDIVLSPEEEVALKKAVATVETNKAQAVLDVYSNSGDFTKLSQGFVIKKMKEWAAGGSTKSQAKEEHNEEEEE
ncbi:hypothetical protein TWF506_011422 [Arthrobotrys conoides]|uniref:Uncharacterized protein n=1 Tax=Arthrobotrys conoides TaxID=74498 RepID=A0AAN8N7B6_9PEZI